MAYINQDMVTVQSGFILVYMFSGSWICLEYKNLHLHLYISSFSGSRCSTAPGTKVADAGMGQIALYNDNMKSFVEMTNNDRPTMLQTGAVNSEIFVENICWLEMPHSKGVMGIAMVYSLLEDDQQRWVTWIKVKVNYTSEFKCIKMN